ncbi:adenosylmethionine--8-amino-7-oxononanoate transaminase [Peptoniphilus asaccharolyticus]
MDKVKELQEKDLKYIWHPCSQMKDYEELPPIVIESGKGVMLYDMNGKDYIDVVSSWWCNLLGHRNETLNKRLIDQLGKIEHVIFSNFTHKPAIELCERLIKHLPKGLAKFNFSDNGSAAVECALKMSFQYQYQTGHKERTKFMCLSEGYHGETIGALSVGSLDLYAKIYNPILLDTIRIEAPDCYRCPYGKNRENCSIECFEKAEESFKKYGRETCAIIIEPLLQGSAGMKIYPAEYIKKLRNICDEYGVLLIADEIATGFGRTGKFFAFDHAGVSPDIMTVSKGLTGGYMPMAITITTDEIYDAFYDEYNAQKAFMHSHTYSGNPLGCSVALGVLDILENENTIEKAQETAAYLHKRLCEEFLDHQNVGEIRHIGLINAIELVKDKETKEGFDSKIRMGYQIYKRALEYGLLLRPLGNILYFNPPLVITKEEIDLAIERMKKAFFEILPDETN